MDSSSAPASAGGSKQDLHLEHITFSKGPSKREKCFIGLSTVLFMIAIIFMILFIIYYLEYEKEKDKDKEPMKKDDTCDTLKCLQIASGISENIDHAVNPCDDFYQFACGTWIKNNPTSASRLAWEIMFAAGAELTAALRELLRDQDPTAPDAIQKARAFYTSCVKTEALGLFHPYVNPREEACLTGTGPWLKLIGSKGANVFPTLDGDSWVDQNWTFSEMLERIPRKPGFSEAFLVYVHPIISFSVEVDPMNSEKRVPVFSQTSDYKLTRFQFVGDRNSQFLQGRELEYAIYLAALGANTTIAREDAKDMVDFEVRLVQALVPDPIDIKTAYTTMTIRQLTDKYPQFDWLGYAQREFSSVGINVTMDEEVGTIVLGFFDRIFDVINSTSQRTLLNYLWWSVIQAYMKLAPTSVDENHENTCAERTNMYFPDAVSRLYVDKHFSERTRDKVEELIIDLQDSFKEILQKTDWMTEQTRTTALEKADAIADKIGYSDDVKNDTYLNEKTKDIVINTADVLESAVNVGESIHRASLSELRQRPNRQKWITSAAIVNAYYNPQSNAIIFPAGILRKPIYRETVVKAVVYGAAGFFIGHEITHAFDNTGGDFDKEGNLRNWWHPEDLQEFERRGQCMVEQYGNFSFPELNMKVNGKLTLGENIADNGGLKEAYLAYKRALARSGRGDPRLPVLDYTPEQLFFISIAQVWCSSQTKEVTAALLQDAHTPNKFRVIGSMQNSVEFAKAFKCPVGSYMNPEKKCHVW